MRARSSRSSTQRMPPIPASSATSVSQRSSHWPRYIIPAISRPALVSQNRRARGMAASSTSSGPRSGSIDRIACNSTVDLPEPASPTISTLDFPCPSRPTRSATSASRPQARACRFRWPRSPSGSATASSAGSSGASARRPRRGSTRTTTCASSTRRGGRCRASSRGVKPSSTRRAARSISSSRPSDSAWTNRTPIVGKLHASNPPRSRPRTNGRRRANASSQGNGRPSSVGYCGRIESRNRPRLGSSQSGVGCQSFSNDQTSPSSTCRSASDVVRPNPTGSSVSTGQALQ